MKKNQKKKKEEEKIRRKSKRNRGESKGKNTKEWIEIWRRDRKEIEKRKRRNVYTCFDSCFKNLRSSVVPSVIFIYKRSPPILKLILRIILLDRIL